MLMQAEPLAKCLDEVLQLHQSLRNEPSRLRVIHLSPRGQILTDSLAREIAIANQEVVLISTRYAGVDERLLQEYAIEEISIGDYILSGGEIPACVLIEAVARHIPGVLGNTVSSQVDSFHDGLLEGPQYTRPRSWRNRVVPDILLCGDQALIKDFHRLLSIKVTAERRFDLIQRFGHELVLLEVDGVIKRAEVVLREAGVASNRRQAGEEIQAIGNEVRQLLLGRLGDKK
jgi:tRNA (guanine37-N1)-methyltransferase